jgi:hypothetical protein
MTPCPHPTYSALNLTYASLNGSYQKYNKDSWSLVILIAGNYILLRHQGKQKIAQRRPL